MDREHVQKTGDLVWGMDDVYGNRNYLPFSLYVDTASVTTLAIQNPIFVLSFDWEYGQRN
jgi:hypothetical protein